MAVYRASPPADVLQLADHLDAVLAAGEDLIGTTLAPATGPAEEGETRPLGAFVASLRHREAGLLLRLLQARRRAVEMRRPDPLLKPALALFAANTAGLVDLVTAFGEQGEATFEAGIDPQLFLRQRGLLAEDSAGLSAFATVRVEESYRVGAVIELGLLLDFVASALDVLDSRYDVYGEEQRGLDLERAGLADSETLEVDVADPMQSALDAPSEVGEAVLTPATLAAALDDLRPQG